MSVRDHRLDLTRPLFGGIYTVEPFTLDQLADEAARAELAVCLIDLSDCHGKPELLQRFAEALQIPSAFGYNWDALADSLRDLSWLPARGHALLIEHADLLRRAAPEDFAILLGVLDDAASFAIERDQPFFVFFSAADTSFDPATD